MVKKSVSIPNGMEFYNSGIPYMKVSIIVSIPNGMEFYDMDHTHTINPLCFNSQRDGILRALKRQEIPLSPKFQFPTGWNSTRYFVASRVRTSSVSIPNGMEFYLYSLLISDKSCVSIPNGMEFYQINKFCFSGRIEFQFPTGWNSTPLISPFAI